MTSPITIEAIKRTVGRHYHVTTGELSGSHRSREIAHPRQMAMYLARTLCPDEPFGRYSQSNIGRMFGGRDHSTVHYGIAEVRKRIASDDDELAKLMAVVIDLHLEGAE